MRMEDRKLFEAFLFLQRPLRLELKKLDDLAGIKDSENEALLKFTERRKEAGD